jgi:Tfp pilus assembly protein PilF
MLKPVWRKIILIILGLFLCAVLLEIALRIGGVVFLSIQEYRNRISANNKGTYRIMCLGESTTALGGKDSYPSQLEEILNHSNKKIKFRVINKGIPAINTNAILSQLEENLNTYKPDMVIAMMGDNDNGIAYYRDIPEADNQIFRHSALYRFCRLLYSQLVAKKMQAASEKTDKTKGEKTEAKRDTKLGWYYKEQGKFIQAEELFKKAIELDPKDEDAVVGLGYVNLELRNYVKMEEAFRKAIEINPGNGKIYAILGHMFYSYMGKLSEAELLLKKAIEINPENKQAYFELGWFYYQQNMPVQAIENFKKITELDPFNQRAYGALTVLLKERGQLKEAEEYYKKIKELKLGYCNSITRDNYLKLKKTLDERGIKLICVQYPMRSIEPLKELFALQTGVFLVDNEKIFKDALNKESHKEYFSDMFAGDFGHATPKGNRLLAQNIANVILNNIFKE